MGFGYMSLAMTSRLEGLKRSCRSYTDKHGHSPREGDDGGANVGDIEPGMTAAATGYHSLARQVQVVCFFPLKVRCVKT